MKQRWRFLPGTVFILLALLLGLAGGIVLDRQVLPLLTQATSSPPVGSLDEPLIKEAWDTINRVYVDRGALQSQNLTYAAISGMVNALGDTDHSRFLTPEMLKSENNFTQGQFEGIGVRLQQKDGQIVVASTFQGSPAQKAGLNAGDIIVQVDGQDLTGLALEQVVTRINGPVGTPVHLVVRDPQTGATRQLALVRARIAQQNVTWQRLPNTTVAHIRIRAFSRGVTQDLQTALEKMQADGVTGVILDLRNNPGGLLDEAVGTASQFLDTGNVLLEKDARGQITKISVRSGGIALALPVVVLVDQNTASAAEIVAGALQDAHRAKLVGEKTFGTGTVLEQYSLSDGSALLLANEEWLTPNGRLIWHTGISPDVTVTLPAGQRALSPNAEQSMTYNELLASGDPQLLGALDLLSPRIQKSTTP